MTTRVPARAGAPAPRASARLGLTLRSVLLNPRDGFLQAVAALERRELGARRPAEGATPYVLSAIGGFALMILWMKVGAMIGVRRVPAASFRWDYVVVPAVLAGFLMLAGQALWGLVAPVVARGLGRETTARELRLVWGAAAFPQVFAVALLLPVDLVIVGPETFTSERLADPLAMVWAAISVSLALSLAVWSGFLLVRGSAVVAKLTTPGGLALGMTAAGCLGLVAAGAYFGLSAAAGWSS